MDRVRERRIEQAIVVDAYTPEERAIGWHCYLDDKLRYPVKANRALLVDVPSDTTYSMIHA